MVSSLVKSYLFPKKKTASQSNVSHAKTSKPDNLGTPKRTGSLTHAQAKSELYGDNQLKSIIDYLPWVEYQDDSKTILLEDGRSVGAVFEVIPYGTEAKPASKLREIRDIIHHAVQDAFEERDNNPWVIQFFCQDDDNLHDYIQRLRKYPKEHAKGTEFTNIWLDEMEKHLHGITKSNGLFIDDIVTKTPWRGQLRRTRMVIYRYLDEKEQFDDFSPEEQLNIVCDNVTNAFKGAGLKSIRLSKNAVHNWLTRWFNPDPDMGKEAFLNISEIKAHTAPDEQAVFNDFAEDLFFSRPKIQDGYWHFDNKPHAVLLVDRLREVPKIGHITGETEKADSINALFDLLPESTIMNLTIVVHPTDRMEEHIKDISDKALGENAASRTVRENCDDAMEYIGQRQKMYRSSLAFYVNGENVKDLKRKLREINTTLNINGMTVVKDEYEVAPASSYLRWMPMVYNPANDPSALYTKFNWCQHLASLLPLFGRSSGTGNSGVTHFNRGGGTVSYDPMEDKAQNGHKLILGPTGAGKSATLVGEISQLMAMHRPRAIIVETGNSFGLMVDYMELHDIKVHRVILKSGSGVVLNPLADSHLLFKNKESDLRANEKKLHDDIVAEASDEDDDNNIVIDTLDESDSDDEGDAQRDVLGEMEISICLMVTGGEGKEYELLRRADRAMIRQAIIMAARQAYDEKRQAIPEDVEKALFEISRDESIPDKRRNKAYEMAEAMQMFTSAESIQGEIFNQQGEPWPDVDVIHVDLATFAREGYEASLAIAYISLINHINNMGEEYQHQSRAIVNITDESHIITVNPLLAAYLTKASKMWRKLGVWLWLATQNMEDFPDAAKKLLSMIEWWEMLVTESSEAEKIRRFKALTDEQVAMITSARKAKNKYTEGVVLSKNVEALFRIVPPSLFLALAMTEKDEKAERMEIMKAEGISELDAAIRVAENLDKARGLIKEPIAA